MCGPSEIVKALEEAGFEILEHRDVALEKDVALTGGSYWYEYLLPSWNIFSQRFQVLLLCCLILFCPTQQIITLHFTYHASQFTYLSLTPP